MCDALIEPSPDVCARHPLRRTLHPELRELFDEGGSGMDMLSSLVCGLDSDGKDIPVLLKHYMKLGAKFHSVGVDPNFNRTPGLLLSVDVPNLAPKMLSTFMGSGAEKYLAYLSENSVHPKYQVTPRNNQVQV